MRNVLFSAGKVICRRPIKTRVQSSWRVLRRDRYNARKLIIFSFKFLVSRGISVIEAIWGEARAGFFERMHPERA